MKKKLVTAVTAASLLATIFGSSVFAASRPAPTPTTDTTSPKAKYTMVTAGADVHYGTVSKAYGFYSDDSDKAASSNGANIAFEMYRTGAAGLGVDTLATADLKAVSSNSSILVTWAYATADGAGIACGTADTAGTAGATLFAASDIVEGVAEDDGDGVYILCLAASTATTAANGTITISASKVTDGASSWVTMVTIPVVAIGPVKTLELSLTKSYRYVAAGNATLDKALTLVGRDANGTILNGATGSITAGVALTGVTETTTNAKNANGEAINFFSVGSSDTVADVTPSVPNEGSARLFDIEADTCAVGDGDAVLTDAGKSYSLSVSAGTIVSNEVSFTCTGDGSKAVMKSVAADVTSFKGKTYVDADGGHSFDIMATIVDENGLPLGNGANATDFGDLTFTVANALHMANDHSDAAVVNGQTKLFDLSPAALASFKKYTYSVKVADTDLGAEANVAKTFSFSYTISNPTTITVKMNAAKTVATVTVNFGADAADESAYLYVETTTGKETIYRKIASASGVATWTVALRKQQVFMTADSDVDGVESSNLAVVTYK